MVVDQLLVCCGTRYRGVYPGLQAEPRWRTAVFSGWPAAPASWCAVLKRKQRLAEEKRGNDNIGLDPVTQSLLPVRIDIVPRASPRRGRTDRPLRRAQRNTQFYSPRKLWSLNFGAQNHMPLFESIYTFCRRSTPLANAQFSSSPTSLILNSPSHPPVFSPTQYSSHGRHQGLPCDYHRTSEHCRRQVCSLTALFCVLTMSFSRPLADHMRCL